MQFLKDKKKLSLFFFAFNQKIYVVKFALLLDMKKSGFWFIKTNQNFKFGVVFAPPPLQNYSYFIINMYNNN